MQSNYLRRRELPMLLGAATAWPLAAYAQPGERMRRIAVLHDYTEADPEGRLQVAAFREELEKLGWIDGRNVKEA
jgi:putative tryptophan/tyrosine transport system substrate-binding protein